MSAHVLLNLLNKLNKGMRLAKHFIAFFLNRLIISSMKKVNKQCLLDTPRTVRVSEKTWQVIVRTRRP